MSTTGVQRETLPVKEAVETRRSIRKYHPESIPRAELDEMLRLVGLAPSAWNLQPWRFVAVQRPEVKEALYDAANRQRQVASAPAVIVMYSDMKDVLENLDEVIRPGSSAEKGSKFHQKMRNKFGSLSEDDRETWGAGQTYIALGYLLLVARSFGYDTSPMIGFDEDEVKRLLDLPEHVAVSALVAIGKADEEGSPHHRHPLGRIVTYR